MPWILEAPELELQTRLPLGCFTISKAQVER